MNTQQQFYEPCQESKMNITTSSLDLLKIAILENESHVARFILENSEISTSEALLYCSVYKADKKMSDELLHAKHKEVAHA